MTVVKIRYPLGLQDMISMFRMCATARLFIDFMLPKVDAGIFLDTDILLMDDIKELWEHFRQFSPSQVMGMAATENIYSSVDNLPYFGPPGVGLNAGVIMMNLTRMRRMAGGGFIGSVRSEQTESDRQTDRQSFCQSTVYIYFHLIKINFKSIYYLQIMY